MTWSDNGVAPQTQSKPARILLVDDEPAILDGLRRQLRHSFDVVTAVGGEGALELVASSEQPFAAVLSDMRMPGMDGAALLTRIRGESPDTVRLLLTGQSDMESTIAAINEGQIYKFLSKPCPAQTIATALLEAVEIYRTTLDERAAILSLQTEAAKDRAALVAREEESKRVPAYASRALAAAPLTLGDRMSAIRLSTSASAYAGR